MTTLIRVETVPTNFLLLALPRKKLYCLFLARSTPYFSRKFTKKFKVPVHTSLQKLMHICACLCELLEAMLVVCRNSVCYRNF